MAPFNSSTPLSGTINPASNATAAFKEYRVTYLIPVMVFALLGNALVILAFIKGPRKIRTYTNYFVVNLAVSDLMVGCLSLPFWIFMNLGQIDSQLKYYHIPLDMLFGSASILSLVAISLERLFSVKYPASHHNLKQSSVIASIALTWAFGIFLFLAAVVIIKTKPKVLYEQYWITIMVFLTFIIPLIVIIVSYVMLFTAAYALMKADNQGTSVFREIRIAKTISVIISLFCICWSPFFTLNLLYSYGVIVEGPTTTVLIHVTKALHYTNSMMNVFVYAVRNPDFRETFAKLLCLFKQKARERALTMQLVKNSDLLKESLMRRKGLLQNGSEENGRLSNATCSETMFDDDDENANRKKCEKELMKNSS